MLPAAGVPQVILKVSDGVAPGQSLSINGEWLDPASSKAALALDTTGLLPAFPPTNAIYPRIIQRDNDGHFIITQLPIGASSGVYDVWVGNSNGWSTCAKMNAARALYMSEKEAYSNIDIEVVGRNFQQSEFGGSGTTMARLNTGSTTYPLSVKDITPFHLTFTVSNQPAATYYVEVSSDSGINWSRLSSGQTLAVLAAPFTNSDPLNLGVSWAKDFNWTNVYNVTQYGVVANSTSDQTAAIQSVEKMAEANGGVVYFPNGNYYVSRINIGADVVLEGQSEFNTAIYYNGPGGSSLIKSEDSGSIGGIPQLQGIANLSLLLSTTNKPDIFIYLGNTSGVVCTNETLRTGNRMFVKGVNLNYPYVPSANYCGVGIGCECDGTERFLFESNNFVGYVANLSGIYVTQYSIDKNNYFEYTHGEVIDAANFYFCEGNYIKCHYEYCGGAHGYDGRSYCYDANNYVQGTGATTNQNDGEAIFCENPLGFFNYGTISRATSSSITVSAVTNLINPPLQYGTLCVLITDGTGLGEMETVASIATNTDVINTSNPFPITPDATSKFTLYCPFIGYTVYSNTVVNCANVVQLYNGGYDTVIANNLLVDNAGIEIHSALTPSTAEDDPCYFQRVTRNILVGSSRRTFDNGIGEATSAAGSYSSVLQYSTEIINNRVTENNTIPENSGYGDAPPYDGVYIDGYDIFNSIIESNQISNISYGVQISDNNYGQYVSANTYDASVLTFYYTWSKPGENIILGSNYLITKFTLPAIIIAPESQAIFTNDTATFYVLANGTPAPYYQWYRDNFAISGANGPSYTAPPAVPGDSGARFSVLISNEVGNLASGDSLLTVSYPTIQPPLNVHVVGIKQ